MTLYDITTEHDYDGIEFSIFRPQANIPEVNAGDVVLVYQVKVAHLHASKDIAPAFLNHNCRSKCGTTTPSLS